MPKYEIIPLDEGTTDQRNRELVTHYPTPGITTVFSTHSDSEAVEFFNDHLGLGVPRRLEAYITVYTTVGTALVATRYGGPPPGRWALVKACPQGTPEGYPDEYVGIKVYRDGGQYCALVGENLQEGIAGFGVTPAGALLDLMAKNADTLNEALGGKNVEVPDETDED